MNKIYYSISDVLSRIGSSSKPRTDCGWGRLVVLLEASLIDYGFDLVDSPLDADIEFYVGQPPLYLKPQMHPSVILSMYETTSLPRSWVESINQWDVVINPSKWGYKCFKDNGVYIPIFVIPLPVDSDKFAYVDRLIDSDWYYLAQAVQLTDRKNIMLVANLFESNKMPDDAKLILKTISERHSVEFDMWADNQVHFVHAKYNFDKYYSDILAASHISVNPSSGEGFGYFAYESMATGMCTLVTNYSAFTDLLESGYAIPIKCTESPTIHYTAGGLDADIDTDDLLKQMLWTYENREKSLEIGKLASQWVAQQCSPAKIVSQLEVIFDKLIKSVPKTVSLYNDEDPIEEWVDMVALGLKKL